MCDYCDCRSQPEIARLSAEHERIGEVLGELRRVAPEHVDRLLDELVAVLAPHSAREEVGLYPQLRAAGIGADVDRLAQEHQLIDAAFAEACRDPSTVGVAADLLARHIFEEETDVFPAARQLLDPSAWSEIDHATARVVPGDAVPTPHAHPTDGASS